MKVCQLLVAGTGGLSKHVIELSNELQGQGHKVIAVVPENCKEELDAGVQYCHLKQESKLRSLIYSLKLLLLIRKINPDVVHAHGKESAIHLGRIKPFIRAITIGTVHWHQKRRKDFRGFDKLDGVIGVGDGVLDLLKNKSRTVIYNGVKKPAASAPDRVEFLGRLGLNGERPLALAIGRLVHGKGFHVLLDAWCGVNANLLIIGDGPEFQTLNEQCRALGLEDRVRITGVIPDAASLLDIADIAIVSSFKEGFSYVIAESLVSGTPVISTEVNGADRLLPPQAVVSVGSADLLRDKINAYLSDKDAFSYLFSDVFSWAKTSLTLGEMAEQVVAYYNKVKSERS